MDANKALRHLGVIVGAVFALGAGAGNCDALRGRKAIDAAEEHEPPGFATLAASCPGSEYYADAEISLQVKCASCHGPGGTGAGKYLFNVGNSLSDQQYGKNYVEAYKRLDLAEPDPTKHPLLSNPLGGPGHPTVMSVFDGEFEPLYSWVDAEVNSPCTVDITSQ
jgi:hypothetical protein